MTVLAVADGASEPLRADAPTCLEEASTPATDRLLRSGVLQRARTVAPGLLPGTEVGLPTLLGVAPAVQPGRGLIEAAGAGIALAADEGAWRVDLPAGATPGAELVARMNAAVASRGARVVHLGGHRCLLIGPAAWGDAAPGIHQKPAPPEDGAPHFRGVVAALTEVVPTIGRPWGTLAPLAGDLPARLDRRVRVVTTSGAVAGIAHLLGCDVERAAPAAGVDVVREAAADDVVVVHDPGPDDAAHAGNRTAKVDAIERFDADVVAPIADVLQQRGGQMVVATDHGCDPASGAHDGAPVPVVLWVASSPEGGSMPRWTERAAAHLGEVPAQILLDEQVRMAAA